MSVSPRLSTQSRGAVRIITNREVTRVIRYSKAKTGGVEPWNRTTLGTNHQAVVDPGEEIADIFDMLVVCTDASAALKLQGHGAARPGWRTQCQGRSGYDCVSSAILISLLQYFWDVTVTHTDLAHMQKVRTLLSNCKICNLYPFHSNHSIIVCSTTLRFSRNTTMTVPTRNDNLSSRRSTLRHLFH